MQQYIIIDGSYLRNYVRCWVEGTEYLLNFIIKKL